MSKTESATRQHDPLSGKRRSLWVAAVHVLALVGLLVTAISLFASMNWIADLFAQFKVQWAIGLIVVIVLLALARQWRWVGICAIGLVINAIPIWPYLFGPVVQTPIVDRVAATSEFNHDSESADGRLRLLSLNVLTSNRRYDDVVSFIESEDSDFVVLLEINSDWEAKLEPLNRRYPFTRFEPREDNFGIAFLSKRAWSKIEVIDSAPYQLPSIDIRFEAMGSGLEGEKFSSSALSRPLRIIATHPIPPISEFNWTARNGQLLEIASRFGASTSNVMAGDLNLTPWSPFFADVLKTGDLRDSALGLGVSPSWYLIPTWIGGLKIDHTLVGSGVIVHSHRIGPDLGSDHRAVVLDFQIH